MGRNPEPVITGAGHPVVDAPFVENGALSKTSHPVWTVVALPELKFKGFLAYSSHLSRRADWSRFGGAGVEGRMILAVSRAGTVFHTCISSLVPLSLSVV